MGMARLKRSAEFTIPSCLLGCPVDLHRTREVLERRRHIYALHGAHCWNTGGRILAAVDGLSATEKIEPWVVLARSYYEEERAFLVKTGLHTTNVSYLHQLQQ